MKVHPRNEGSDSIDLAMLIGMPVSIAVLTAIIWWLSLDLQSMTGAGG